MFDIHAYGSTVIQELKEKGKNVIDGKICVCLNFPYLLIIHFYV